MEYSDILYSDVKNTLCITYKMHDIDICGEKYDIEYINYNTVIPQLTVAFDEAISSIGEKITTEQINDLNDLLKQDIKNVSDSLGSLENLNPQTHLETIKKYCDTRTLYRNYYFYSSDKDPHTNHQ